MKERILTYGSRRLKADYGKKDSGKRKLNAYILFTSTKHKRENKNVIRLLISNPPMVTYFLQGVHTTETSPKNVTDRVPSV